MLRLLLWGNDAMKILVVEPMRLPYEKEMAPSLTAMQAVVGGTIQAIYPFEEPVALICNDEAKLLGMPLNRALYASSSQIYDVVAGTFFLCNAPLNSSEFTSLNDEQIQRFMRLFRCPERFIRIGSHVVAIQTEESEKGEVKCPSTKLTPR